jgi:hypothetical protein
MKLHVTFPLLIATIVIVGCSPSEKAEPEPKKSSVTTFIEGATGKTAVDAGQRAKEDIKRISAARNDDLNEAMGE